jgi:hypothetical protein
VDITEQFQKIGIVLAEEGFVAILKEATLTVMASVKLPGISGEESAHNGRDGSTSRPQKEVYMVG